MKYVIRFGKRLYLSQKAGYVNNMTDLNIRQFSAKEKALANLIAKDIDGEVVRYEPKKRRKKRSNQSIKYTNYELDNLLVLKKDNLYYTKKMELTKKLRNKSVLKLTMAEAQQIINKYPNYEMTIAQLRTEVESKKPKNKSDKGVKANG